MPAADTGRVPVACQRCGHDNEPSEHFCASCGAFLGWGGEAPAGTEPAAGGTTQFGSPAPPQDDQHAGVQIQLQADQVKVAPGGEASVAFTVRNQGTQVEEFLLTVAGPGWLAVEPPTVSVFPGQEATGTLQAVPPRAPSSLAGVQPFRLTAASAIHPNVASSVSGQVDVDAFYELNAELVPTTSTGRGWTRHHVILGNRGNSPLRILLSPADVPDGLQLSLPPSAQVEPGQIAEVPVAVQGRRVWLGRPEPKPFSLTAEPPRPLAPSRLSGTRTVVPVFPRWVPAVAGIAVAAVAIGAVAAAKLHSHHPPIGGGQHSPTVAASTPHGGATTPSKSASPTPKTSTTPTQVQIANVAGDSQQGAISQLTGQQLTPVATAVYDSSVQSGQVVGTQPGAGQPAKPGEKVKVLVSAGIDDLVAEASSATWTANNNGSQSPLTFPGSQGEQGGGAFACTSQVQLEDGSYSPVNPTTEGLETDTPNQANASVTGTYAFSVFPQSSALLAGEHFRASLGFVDNTTGTVDYQVIVTTSNGTQVTVANNQHNYTGQLVPIDVNLNKYAGATKIALTVMAINTPGPDNIVWVSPRVEPASAPPPAG